MPVNVKPATRRSSVSHLQSIIDYLCGRLTTFPFNHCTLPSLSPWRTKLPNLLEVVFLHLTKTPPRLNYGTGTALSGLLTESQTTCAGWLLSGTDNRGGRALVWKNEIYPFELAAAVRWVLDKTNSARHKFCWFSLLGAPVGPQVGPEPFIARPAIARRWRWPRCSKKHEGVFLIRWSRCGGSFPGDCGATCTPQDCRELPFKVRGPESFIRAGVRQTQLFMTCKDL